VEAMNRKYSASLAIMAALTLSACGSGGDNSQSICQSTKTIAGELAATLELIVADFSGDQNDRLAQSLDDLRNLAPTDTSLDQSKKLLEDSIESLMSDLNAGDPSSASNDVIDMTTAIQSITAACSN
jgi:hypothetical protein